MDSEHDWVPIWHRADSTRWRCSRCGLYKQWNANWQTVEYGYLLSNGRFDPIYDDAVPCSDETANHEYRGHFHGLRRAPHEE